MSDTQGAADADSGADQTSRADASEAEKVPDAAAFRAALKLALDDKNEAHAATGGARVSNFSVVRWGDGVLVKVKKAGRVMALRLGMQNTNVNKGETGCTVHRFTFCLNGLSGSVRGGVGVPPCAATRLTAASPQKRKGRRTGGAGRPQRGGPRV